MDLTTGSINFHVRSRGSYLLLDQIYSGPSVTVATPLNTTSFVSSSSEVNPPIIGARNINSTSCIRRNLL
jgi:hypothetical protein